MVFLIALVVVVAGLGAALVAGRIGGQLDPPTHTSPFEPLPDDREVRSADIENLRFDQTVRGYRMGQVDQVLDRLSAELAERDRLIAELERTAHDTSYDRLTRPAGDE